MLQNLYNKMKIKQDEKKLKKIKQIKTLLVGTKKL